MEDLCCLDPSSDQQVLASFPKGCSEILHALSPELRPKWPSLLEATHTGPAKPEAIEDMKMKHGQPGEVGEAHAFVVVESEVSLLVPNDTNMRPPVLR